MALRWALLHAPGAAEVLDRLNSPIVETAAPGAIFPDTRESPTPVPDERAMCRELAPMPNVISSSHAVVIKWANVPVRDRRPAAHHAATGRPGDVDMECWGARTRRMTNGSCMVPPRRCATTPAPSVSSWCSSKPGSHPCWKSSISCARCDETSGRRRMIVLPVAMSPQAHASHVYQQQCDIWQRKLNV